MHMTASNAMITIITAKPAMRPVWPALLEGVVSAVGVVDEEA